MSDPRPTDGQPTEADAQKTETVMPLVWSGLGLLVVLGFLAVLIMGPKSSKPAHPIVAPMEAAAKSGG